jgi:hypothetical protein
MATARFAPGRGGLPSGARQAGYESNHEILYVAHAAQDGGVHPGKYRPGWEAASIPYGGREVWVPGYEVWVGKLSDGSGGAGTLRTTLPTRSSAGGRPTARPCTPPACATRAGSIWASGARTGSPRRFRSGGRSCGWSGSRSCAPVSTSRGTQPSPGRTASVRERPAPLGSDSSGGNVRVALRRKV